MASGESYVPTVWERLMAAGGSDDGQSHTGLERLKMAVAQDLEGLLNTRVAIPHAVFEQFPLARQSVLNYGLIDFADMCLSSDEDRKVLSAAVKDAIERFEPRLSNVTAEVFIERGATNQLKFVIVGTLRQATASGQVRFDAMLRPSNLHYSISLAPREGRR
ncbi:MAG: type VI secretion system baseplate subunit TssE [Pseudomonadota bacterium]